MKEEAMTWYHGLSYTEKVLFLVWNFKGRKINTITDIEITNCYYLNVKLQ